VTSAGLSDLKIGVMRLHFRTDGKTPSVNDLLKIQVIGAVMTSRQRCRKYAEILSGPDPQVVDSESRSEKTSSVEIEIWEGRNEN